MSVFFILVGLAACAVSLLVEPSWKGAEYPARVIRVEKNDQGLERPVFGIESDLREYSPGIWSGKSRLVVGQQVTIVKRLDGPDWHVKGDPGMRSLQWGMRFLGGIFLFIGLPIFMLRLFGANPRLANAIGGSLAALTASVPMAALAPACYWFYRTRPNILYDMHDDPPNMIAAGVISLGGILFTAFVVWLIRKEWRMVR